MNAKSLFGYAVAVSLLATGFASCNPEEQKDDNTPDRPTVTVRYSVEVTEVTETSVKAEVSTTGEDTDTWYAFITSDLDTGTDVLIESTVAGLDDIESVLKSGDAEVGFDNLTAGTSYRIVVTGLSADGTVSGKSDEAEFTTERDPNVWNVNKDWSISYVERGSYEVGDGSTTKYGDLISVVVPDDNTEYFTYEVIKVSDFESVYGSDAAKFLNAVVEDYNTMIEEWNEQYPEYPASILDMIMNTSGQFVLDPLDDADYYLFLVGITPVGITGEGSGLYAQSEAIHPDIQPASEEYKKWIGDWTFSGQNEVGTYNEGTGQWEYEVKDINNVVTIAEDIPNYSYKVINWQPGLWENPEELYAPARYDANSQALQFYTNEEYGKFDLGDGITGDLCFLGVYAYGSGSTIVTGGPYEIAEMTMDGTGNVTFTKQSIQITGGQTLECIGMEYCALSGQQVYTFPAYSYPKFDEKLKVTKAEGMTNLNYGYRPEFYFSSKSLSNVAAANSISPVKKIARVR